MPVIEVPLAAPREPIRVNVPDGMTMQQARDQLLRGGQISLEDIGQQSANAAEGAGALEAMMVQAGGLASTIPDRFEALLGSETSQRRVRESDAMLRPMSEERPVSSFVGNAIPGLAIPGGLPAQVVGGAALGALENPENPIIGGTLGGALSYGGARVGDLIGEAANAGIGSLTRRSAAATARRANVKAARKAGMPITPAERSGSAVAEFFDRQASTVLGRQVKGPTKQAALNRTFSKALGVGSEDALTGDVLGQAARNFGSTFENVANNVDEIPLTGNISAEVTRLEQLAEELMPNARGQKTLEMFKNMLAGDQLSGKQYNRFRSLWSRFSRNEWKPNGDQVTGEFIDEVIGVMDQALVEAAPEFADELVDARSGWRLLQAVRRGAALDPTGNVNPVSMARSLESTYPGLDMNRFSPGAIGKAQRTNLAAQAFPNFRSSGSPERGILANLGGLTVGLAEIIGGGGARQQIGGAAARAPGPYVTHAISSTADALLAYLGNEQPDEPEAQER